MALTTNLDSYWKFDESSGNAVDVIHSNTLVNTNTVTYSTGKINNGAYLAKASKQYFTIADASQTGLDPTGDCTFNIWAYLQSAVGGAEEYPIFWKFTTAVNQAYGARLQNDNTLYWVSSSNGGADAVSKTVSWTPSTATWYMLTFKYTAAAGSIAFYVNGTQQGSTQTGLPTSIQNGTSPFMVGQRIVGGDTTTNWDGRFDELGVWSRALSDSEITQLYNAGAGLQYPFVGPSVSPSISPSVSPSLSPSVSPSKSPSLSPSISPSLSPSISPSVSPSSSLSPSVSPSVSPSASQSPSTSPSLSPSISPSVSPSPSLSPSISPSISPSKSPSLSPSISPSLSPSPSISPSISPSVSPSASLSPSISPSVSPSSSISPSPSPQAWVFEDVPDDANWVFEDETLS